MAHNGILFLDELPEFGRQVLDMLRRRLRSDSLRSAAGSSLRRVVATV